jgi:hypothetical protein
MKCVADRGKPVEDVTAQLIQTIVPMQIILDGDVTSIGNHAI